jgi:Lrp/AsnC family leucine-responsive transcriptional regulator
MRKLDVKDRRLLYELDVNSRRSNRQLAKAIGVSEQVLGYRIKRLLEEGTIKSFHIRFSPLQMGFIHLKVYVRLFNITPKSEQEMIAKLVQNRNLFWFVSTRGKYDMVLTFVARSVQEFDRVFKEINKEFGKYFFDKDIVFLTSGWTYTRNYLAPNQERESYCYGLQGQVSTMDESDEEIVRAIATNARLEATSIAKEVGLGPDAIRYRLKRLEESHLITGYGVNIRYAGAGRTYYILLFHFQNMNEEKFAKLKEIGFQNENVIIHINTIGSHDVEFELEVAEKKELDALLLKLRSEFAGDLKDYELIEVTNEHKWSYYPF